MVPRALLRLFARKFVATAGFVSPLRAMTFTLVEPVALAGAGPRPTHVILGGGPILPGDAQLFEAFKAQLPATDIAKVQRGIALNSRCGRLPEGVRLGEAFRENTESPVCRETLGTF